MKNTKRWDWEFDISTASAQPVTIEEVSVVI